MHRHLGPGVVLQERADGDVAVEVGVPADQSGEPVSLSPPVRHGGGYVMRSAMPAVYSSHISMGFDPDP